MLHVELQLQLPPLHAVLLLPGLAPPDPLDEAVAHTDGEQHQARHQQDRPGYSGGLWEEEQVKTENREH